MSTRGGGGGGVIPYAYWVCAARETPIFSPEFPFRTLIFTNFQKNPFWSITMLHFFGGFCRSGDHLFKISLISTRLSPPTARDGRLSPNAKRSAAPQVSQTRPGSSGDSHFHAQNGGKLVSPEPRIFKLKTAQARSGAPAFSRFTGSSFRSPCPFFTLPRHIPTKIWGEYIIL